MADRARCKPYDHPKLKPELGASASHMAESRRCTCPGIRPGSVAQPGSGAWFVAGSPGMAGKSPPGAARVAPFLLHSPAARRRLPIVSSPEGSASRLKYQPGCCGRPPCDATTMKAFPSTRYRRGTVRDRPDLRPLVVSKQTGAPEGKRPNHLPRLRR